MRIGNYSSRAIVTGILMMGTLAAQAQQENMETIVDLHHIMAYLVATFLISVFVMFFYNRLIYFREKDVTKEAERLIAQLSLVMDANKTQAWAYDIEKDFYTVFSGKDKTSRRPMTARTSTVFRKPSTPSRTGSHRWRCW